MRYGSNPSICRRMYGASMRADQRRVISGIVHVLKKNGCRWCDCTDPSMDRSVTTIV